MKTCLIVDDSRIIRKVARRILEDLGFEVAEAADGVEALAWCRSLMPEAILLDWNMPAMDGLTFLRQLRADPGGDQPTVLFCTVENEPARIVEALAAGANEYVMKPFDGDILESKFVEAGLILVAIGDSDLAHLADLVKAACGIVIAPDKGGLIESRLGPVARREGYTSVTALIERLRAETDQALVRAVVDALRLSETQFFRDRTPFEQFRREVLPAISGARPGGRMRVWSAGCSTGQEPYSLAMVVEEARDAGTPVDVELIATDISDRSLEKARSGIYTQFEVQRGLPVRLMVKHFEKVEENWRATARLRQAVRWGRFNLMHEPRPLGRVDVIFCRNVLSQFDEPTRGAVLERLGTALADDGVLFLGLNETTHGLTEMFRPIPGRRGLYCKSPTHLKRVA